MIPESSAACAVTVTTDTPSTNLPGEFAVWDKASSITGAYPFGAFLNGTFITDCTNPCGPVANITNTALCTAAGTAILGHSFNGKGIVAKGGTIGLEAVAGNKNATPLVVQGDPCQAVNLATFRGTLCGESIIDSFASFSTTGSVTANKGVIGSAPIGAPAFLAESSTGPVIVKAKSTATSGNRGGIFRILNNNATPAGGDFGIAGNCDPCGIPPCVIFIRYATPPDPSPPAISIDKCGFVGVGTSSPSSTLEVVNANAGTSTLIAKGASGQTANLQQWQKGCTVKSVVNKCGWLGIGTSTPQTALQVKGGMSLNIKRAGTSCVTMKTSCFALFAPTAGKTVTLPAAKNGGMVVFIKNTSAGSVTVKGAGSGAAQDKIESLTTYSLAANTGITLIANGKSAPGTWFFLSNTT